MGIDLARRAHTYLTQHPDQYDGHVWIGEDRTDLAGLICIDAGAEPIWTRPDKPVTGTVLYADRHRQVVSLARSLLGITAGEAAKLFQARNSLDDLDHIITLLEHDRMIFWPARTSVGAIEHAWINDNGRLTIACHRRSVLVQRDDGADETVHSDRTAALAYARHYAGRRGLAYIHNTDIWETPE